MSSGRGPYRSRVKDAGMRIHELKSKLLKGGYIGDCMGSILAGTEGGC